MKGSVTYLQEAPLNACAEGALGPEAPANAVRELVLALLADRA